jgi:hypothetical protein
VQWTRNFVLTARYLYLDPKASAILMAFQDALLKHKNDMNILISKHSEELQAQHEKYAKQRDEIKKYVSIYNHASHLPPWNRLNFN